MNGIFAKLSLAVCVLCLGLLRVNAQTAVTPTISANQSSKLDCKSLPCFWNNSCKYRCEIQLAQKYAIYAIVSCNAYQTNDSQNPKIIPFPKSEHWLLCTNRANSKNGFYAELWQRTKSSGTTEIIVVYRGTENSPKFWKDWGYGNCSMVGNFSLLPPFYFAPSQYREALAFARMARQQNPGSRIIFTGHSLGGGLAEYVQGCVSNSEAVVFDSSPNTGFIRSGFHSRFQRHVTRLFEKGEVLMWFRRVFGGTKVITGCCQPAVGARWFDFYASKNPVSQHSIADFAMNLIKLSALHGDKDMEEVREAVCSANDNQQKHQ
ncbi:MAG: hypothetical protein WCH99_13795 [Verrucomicrobiota bacterium]